MFAIYFNGTDGGHSFIAAVDDRQSAFTMAKLLSRQDPREIVVIENRPIGDTVVAVRYRRGALHMDATEDDLPAAPVMGSSVHVPAKHP